MSNVCNLDKPLVHLLSPVDHLTLQSACKGVYIFGGIGSGKTSATGRALAGAYLRAGMRGLVLTAKQDEVRNGGSAMPASTGEAVPKVSRVRRRRD